MIRPPTNAPGLDALAYRLGAWADFRDAMLAQARSSPALAGLAAHDPHDPAVALLDAWAAFADVFTFYQERIANEGFLRTATETRSLAELARAAGHEPFPGASATAFLAFTVDDRTASAGLCAIPPGLKVASLPAQGQRPQVFETLEGLDARAEWNAIPAQPAPPVAAAPGDRAVTVRARAGAAREGDAILVRAPGPIDAPWALRRVVAVAPGAQAGTLTLSLDGELGSAAAGAGLEAHVLRARPALFGRNAPVYRPATRDLAATVTNAQSKSSITTRHEPFHGRTLQETTTTTEARVAKQPTEAATWGPPTPSSDWPDLRLGAIAAEAGAPGGIVLAGSRAGLAPGSWLVLTQGRAAILCRVRGVAEVAMAKFGLRARCLAVALEGDVSAFDSAVRTTLVLAGSEALAVVSAPVAPAWGPSTRVALASPSAPLRAGQRIAFSGRRLRALVAPAGANLDIIADDGAARPAKLATGESLVVLTVGAPGAWRVRDAAGLEGTVHAPQDAFVPAAALPTDETVGEVALIASTSAKGGVTTATLARGLRTAFDPATLRANANVCVAGHGERVQEALGNGDARRVFPRFTLARPGLARRRDPETGDLAPALRVEVHQVPWSRVDSLLDAGPHDAAYAIQTDEQGRTVVRFGDGRTGARLPTGAAVVVATYHAGVGTPGNVPAGALTNLLARPLGLRGVTNPEPAEGGADPAGSEDLRIAVPLSATTLGRVVSVRDHEDFARQHAGVGLARAARVVTRRGPGVRLLVVDASGQSVVPPGLVDALVGAGADPERLDVRGWPRVRVDVDATVRPASPGLPVVEAARDALRAAFAFGSPGFGRPVDESRVVALLQRVEGVAAVLDARLRAPEAAADPTTTALHVLGDVRVEAAP